VVAGALHENGHLVRHQSDVGLGAGEDGQAGTLPGRGHEEKARCHLDDSLPDLAPTEVPPGTACQGLEPGGQRGQVLGVRLVQAA
jgi:hypothetical protein